MSKKTIVFDFDGVIHLGYEGWKDGTIYGTINWRLLDYIEELLEDYYVVISTNRPAQQIVDYFEKIKENIEPLKFEVFKSFLLYLEELIWHVYVQMANPDLLPVGIIIHIFHPVMYMKLHHVFCTLLYI